MEDSLIAEAEADGVGQLVVGAIVPRLNNTSVEILVLDRAKDDFMGGIEELPSGKVESGESLTDALKRELLEETALSLYSVLGYVFSFDYSSSSGMRSRQFNFVVDVNGSDVRIDESEHQGYRWINRDDLSGSRVTQNVIELIANNWKQIESAINNDEQSHL